MDIFYSVRKKYILAAVLTLLCCLIMVMFPSTSLNSARKGISLWLTDVMPALLPFFICANFLTGLGVIGNMNPSLFPFVMSVLSGYPVGAKIIGDMRRNGEISLLGAKRLISFCSTSGPAFIMGAVGSGMLGSERSGTIIAVAHYSGAILNGMLYGKFAEKEKLRSFRGYTLRDKNLQELFTEATLKSLRSLGVILVYIVLFMLLTDFIQLSGILFLFEKQHTRALIKGMIEMTIGCSAISECVDLTDTAKCIACSFIISWGGLSVLGQSMSMLAGSGISAGYLFLTKLTHGLFSAAVAFVIILFML